MKYFLILLLSLAGHAHAGGPGNVCSGVPTKYAGAGTITLNYDQSSLGSRSKSQADALVTEAVALWTNVNTSTVTLARGSDLPVNVTTANYSTYSNNISDGISPVIYDSDGSIIDMLYGVGAKNSTLGFAGSGWYVYPTYCQYAEGSAVINGYITKSDTEMKITLAHEVGHLIGLDHTQIDSTQGLSSSYPSNYPLMYPIAYRDAVSLHEDDVAAVSALYPESNLSSVYGQLSGTFTQTGGTPIRGANLWVKETTNNKVFSVVSDYLEQNTGYFKLLLLPGTYTLHAEAVQADFTNGSSVGPYSELSSSTSFQSPLYVGGVAMTPVTLGNTTPTQIAIVAGCAAQVGFKLDGSGQVSGNCGATCSYTLSHASQSAAATGQSGTITVSSTSGCAWTAASNASWITVTSGASGSGTGTVAYSVSANTGTSARTGTLTVAGQTFTVTQAGASCSYALSSTSQSAAATGLSGTISVSSTSGCAWTAVSNASWITVTSGASGSSNGTVAYSVAANTGSSSRTGTLTIAGITFTLTQSGSSLTSPNCALAASPASLSAGEISTLTASCSPAATSYTWTGGNCAGNATNTCSATSAAAGITTYTVRGTNAAGSGNTASVTVTFADSSATNLLLNPGFESGASSWVEYSGAGYALVNNDARWAHAGSYYAYLGGYDNATEALYQNVAIPANAQTATVQFWYRITTTETSTGTMYDKMTVDLYSVASGSKLVTLETLSNLDASSGWLQSAQFDVSAYKGQTVQLRFTATTDSLASSAFRVDDVDLTTTTACAYSISPTSRDIAASSSTGSVTITASSGCAWTATSNASWITVTSGASGSGSGTVAYSVSANTDTRARSGTLTLAGETFTVTQAGASCTSSSGCTLTGNAGNDTLTGGTGDDALFGLEGDDTLTPGAGNNLVYGGTGTDVLVTDSTAYGDVTTLAIARDTLVVYDGASTRHVVRGVETLRVDGTDYPMPAATDDIEQDIVQIYVAAFARAPALGGYDYWKAEKATKGIANVADTIFSLSVVKAIYPDSLPDEDFVSAIFLNVFGRAVQAGGLAYWAGELAAKSRGQLVLDMTTSAL
ncbi:MAG: BACON domain-containing carbohydrate-binding protein, partial [Sideroxyarcus sp.]|nr:BACON domain-containing carbohydrate-binding protein [Sideroxyarcus sp.]